MTRVEGWDDVVVGGSLGCEGGVRVPRSGTDSLYNVHNATKCLCVKTFSSRVVVVTIWLCAAEVTSSFVIFAVLVLRVVLTRLCKL